MTRRPGMPVLLVCIVIASALVGGAWWRLKPSQLANKAARTEKMAPKTDGHCGKGRAGRSIRRDGSESRQHQCEHDIQ